MHVKKFLVVFVVFMSVIGFSMIVLPSSLNDNGNHNLNNSVDDKYSQISSHNNSIPSKVNSYVNHVKSNINYNVTKFNKSTSYNSSNSNLSNLLFLPNKDAKAFYKIVDGTVTPLYTNAPAPMGIGDFGVTNDSTGSLVSQNFNTTSFEGVVNISSLNALYSSKCFEPRSVSFQLNTVLANVTLFGITNYTMWTQNVIVYSTRTHELSFEDNLWNFSSPASYLTSNAIYKSIGNNYMYPGVHIAIGPTYKLDTPFLVYLYINTTNIDSRNAVYFNYSIPALSESGTYNEVIFNSTYGMPSSYKTPMDYFEVNGNKVTPTGYLLYDAELMIGGPGGGSTTQIYNVNGNMKLLFLNDTTKAYTSVPSAYDYGTDTGETSQGVSVYYTGTTAHLSTGPSFLHGLWNITNNPGYITLEGKISPSNGYVFVNPGSHIYNSTAQWAATSISGSFDYKISPGTYSLQVLASDYEPHYINSLSGSSGAILSQSISLTKNTSYGVYTPLTAMNNSQLKNISYMGNGTASSPYMLLDSSPVIDPVFGLLNDFGYPEFAGIMLYNTSKYVSTVGITQPFVDAMPMPVDLYNASNVSLSGMSLYPDYIGDSLLIWYSNNDVISLNSFTAFGIGYINSSSDISYTSNYLDNSILYLCNDTTNIVNNEFYNSLLAGCNSDMNVMSNHVSGSTLSYTNGNTNSTANTFINSGEASFNNTLNAYDNNYISSYLYIHGDLNSNINNSLIINSLYFNVFGNGNMNNDTYLQSYIIDSYANIDINNVNFNETVMCSTNSDNTVNNSYGNMLSLGMYGNLSLNNDHLNNTELINEYNNLSANNSFLNESEYISLYSNNTVSNSTFINYVDYNIYGNNVYNNDKFTSNMYIPYINSEFIPDSLVLYGNSNVMNSLFYSKNTNVGSSIQIYYGTSTVENNMLKSDNVSLINNPTGYGSSILAYGGINVIKNNIFITINSPAKSIYDNYFADPAVMGNEYEYSVTFNKISPKNDTLWNLTVNGKTYTTDNSSILLIMSPGTYNYSASSYGYSKITGTVNVISSSVTVNLNFKLAPKYSVTFTETGLPSNTLWNVTLHGVTESSNTSSIVFNVVNGTYNYEISTDNKNYAPEVPYNMLTVNGTSISVLATFKPVTYSVTFTETGLPSNTLWNVTLHGVTESSNTSSIVFNVVNGTYNYEISTNNSEYEPLQSTGTLKVDGSQVLNIVKFKEVEYAVTFTETGLPSGATWHLNLSNGQSFNTNVSSLTFYEPNGTYYYTVSYNNTYNVEKGGFDINGNSIPVSLSFHSIVYNVTFTETGLKSGASWSVTFDGMTKTSSTSTITFENISNGVYSFSVSSVKGYIAPSSSSVAVDNGNIVVPVTYSTPVSYTFPVLAGVLSGVLTAAIIGLALPLLIKRFK